MLASAQYISKLEFHSGSTLTRVWVSTRNYQKKFFRKCVDYFTMSHDLASICEIRSVIDNDILKNFGYFIRI